MNNADPFEPEASPKQYRKSPTSGGDYSSLPEAVEHPVEHGKEVWRSSKAEKEVAEAEEKEAVREDGKEVAGADEKELATAEGKEVLGHSEYGLSTSADHTSRIRKPFIWIGVGVALLLILGIGLGVGLGIGLKHSQSTSPSPANVSVSGSSSEFLSTRGAFNGTGIAVVAPATFTNLTSGQVEQVPQSKGNIQLFFQHHSGEIRWMQLVWPNSWSGGSVSDVVATDAKNGTPISAYTTNTGIIQQWFVFYINQENMLSQRNMDNSTFKWTDGLLNGHVTALDADKVGMQVCFYDGPINNINTTDTDPYTGIQVFVATSETTFDQLAWRPGLPQWTLEKSWSGLNGYASPTCYGWAAGPTTYVMFVDSQNAIGLYSNDASLNATSHQPTEAWNKSSVVFPNVDPLAGLSYHGNLYARLAENGTIRGWNISFAGENSTIVPSNVSAFDGAPGVTNTNLKAWTIPPYDEAIEEVLVFYQTQGDDITMYAGNASTGMWSNTTLPIPDD